MAIKDEGEEEEEITSKTRAEVVVISKTAVDITNSNSKAVMKEAEEDTNNRAVTMEEEEAAEIISSKVATILVEVAMKVTVVEEATTKNGVAEFKVDGLRRGVKAMTNNIPTSGVVIEAVDANSLVSLHSLLCRFAFH